MFWYYLHTNDTVCLFLLCILVAVVMGKEKNKNRSATLTDGPPEVLHQYFCLLNL